MPSLRSFSNGHDEFRLISEGGLSDARLGQPTVCFAQRRAIPHSWIRGC